MSISSVSFVKIPAQAEKSTPYPYPIFAFSNFSDKMAFQKERFMVFKTKLEAQKKLISKTKKLSSPCGNYNFDSS